MKKWYEVVKEALRMLQHSDEYAYFYGAKGQRHSPTAHRATVRCSYILAHLAAHSR